LQSVGQEAAVNPVGAIVATRPVPIFEFEDLAGLPCGCVTAAFRAAQWGVTLVSIEAKGTHCTLSHHFVGQVVHLAEDLAEQPDEDQGETAAAA